MAATSIKISAIRADDAAQTRARTDHVRIKEYGEDMKAGAAFPPVDVFRDDEGNLWLADGFHRLAAACAIGLETIDAQVHAGSLADAIRFSAKSNSTHGIPRTNEDRRRACRAVLALLSPDELEAITGRQLAALTNTSHVFANGELAAFRDPDLAGKMQSSGASARQLRREQELEELPAPRSKGELSPDETALGLLMDTAVADDPIQIAMLAGLPVSQQFDVAELIHKGEADTVPEALALIEQAFMPPLAESSQNGNPPPAAPPEPVEDEGTDAGAPAAAPAIVFATEADFLKAARALNTKQQREQADNDEWVTPDALLDALRAEGFRFTLDVAATPENTKAPRFFTKEDNALMQSWVPVGDDDGDVWMNHPYTLTAEFMARAFQAGMDGERTVVCLPKADTETAWWWNYARFGQVRILPRRIPFNGGRTTGRFANVLVIFPATMAQPGYKPSVTHWDWRGDWNADLPLVASQAVKQGGVQLGDRVFLKQPADFEQPDAPLIWTPHRLPESSKSTRRAG